MKLAPEPWGLISYHLWTFQVQGTSCSGRQDIGFYAVYWSHICRPEHIHTPSVSLDTSWRNPASECNQNMQSKYYPIRKKAIHGIYIRIGCLKQMQSMLILDFPPQTQIYFFCLFRHLLKKSREKKCNQNDNQSEGRLVEWKLLLTLRIKIKSMQSHIFLPLNTTYYCCLLIHILKKSWKDQWILSK